MWFREKIGLISGDNQPVKKIHVGNDKEGSQVKQPASQTLTKAWCWLRVHSYKFRLEGGKTVTDMAGDGAPQGGRRSIHLCDRDTGLFRITLDIRTVSCYLPNGNGGHTMVTMVA